jgi:hypothetical protein
MNFGERIDFEGIRSAALRAARSLLPELLPGGKFEGGEYVVRNPLRDDRTAGSFKINSRTGVWKDFATEDDGSDLISLVAYLRGRSQLEAARELAAKVGISVPKLSSAPLDAESSTLVVPVPASAPAPLPAHHTLGPPSQTWTYNDAHGDAIGYVLRFDRADGKEFRTLTLWRDSADGGLEWRWKSWPVKRPLYGQQELAERPSAAVVVCEGEKSADAARRLLPSFVVVTSPNGSKSADKADWSPLRGRDVVVWPDADVAGHEYAQAVGKCATDAAAKSVAVVSPPAAVKESWDAADALDEGWTPDRAAELISQALSTPADSSVAARLRPLALTEFLSLAIKPREMLLDPILPEKGLMMLFAPRGIGKTLAALGIALAAASGTKFLEWPAPKPRRVLLVDGEMPAVALQERLASIIESAPDIDLDPGNLKILAADLVDAGGIGNLASPEVQRELDQWLDGVDLLILDNLSSLTAVVRDNDAESWGPIQEWLLKLRRRGISVLIVHHAGKGGQQRGTSRREDVLDTIVSLRRPADYSPTEGARFEVHFEKHRGFFGAEAEPFEAKLEECNGAALWTTRKLEDVNRARVQALLDENMSVRDIAEETGIPKSTVHRIKKALAKTSGDGHGG